MGDWAAGPAELLGRKEALSAALAGLERGGGVLLVGAAGVGKTALARAAIERYAEGRSCHVLWLPATASGQAIPFGAFAPFLGGLDGQAGGNRDLFFLLQTARRALVELADGKSLVIGVDSGNHLDDASATLLFQLASTGRARVAITALSGDTLPKAVTSLWKDQIVERIDLGPLSEANARELARLHLGGPLEGVLAKKLWKTTAGNPLYIRELLIAGIESGQIRLWQGVWRLQGDLPVGPRLTELLDERLKTVSGQLLRSLEMVALGDPLPLEVLERVVPAAQAEALQRQSLLIVEGATTEARYVRTAHPLYSKLLRTRIPPNRASELRNRLADAFDAVGRSSSDLLRVVAWRLDAGARLESSTLLTASMKAGERLDWALSARLAEAAANAGEGREAFEASIAFSSALTHLGKHEEALEIAESLAGSTDIEAARVAVLRASILFWGLGRGEDAKLALRNAEPTVTSSAGRAWLTATRAGMLNFVGRPSEATTRARAVLQIPDLDPEAKDRAYWALSVGLGWSGRCEESLKVLSEVEAEPAFHGPDMCPNRTNPFGMHWPVLARMSAYRLAGRVEDLEELASEEYQRAQQLFHPAAQGAALGSLGWVALVRGQLSLSVLRLREAIASLEGGDFRGMRLHLRACQVEALALAGDTAGAAAALTEARQDARPWQQWASPRLQLSTAWARAARGQTSRALAQLDEAAEEARASGQATYEVAALATQVRLGVAKNWRRLEQLAGHTEGQLAQALLRHGRALAGAAEGSTDEETGDTLDKVAERYADLGLLLYGAEAAAHASQAHNRAGSMRKAAGSAARAQALLGDPTGPLPLTIGLATAPASLTSREREVALLARNGLSSQTIAAQLNLSVRTVDTHLARVYLKLGISGRGELRDALSPATEAPAS